MDKYEKLIEIIERYRKTKNDNIFDAFYHSHLDLMIDCIQYTKANKADPEEKEANMPDLLE